MLSHLYLYILYPQFVQFYPARYVRRITYLLSFYFFNSLIFNYKENKIITIKNSYLDVDVWLAIGRNKSEINSNNCLFFFPALRIVNSNVRSAGCKICFKASYETCQLVYYIKINNKLIYI